MIAVETTIDVAIIGGTGIGERLLEKGGREIAIPTEDGWITGRVIDHDGVSILLLGRHSAGHKVPPHLVPYKAMARAAASLGVKGVLATAAVGSLVGDWPPGTLVVPNDLLDLTYRNLTLYDETVHHQDVSEPFHALTRRALLAAPGPERKDGGVYLGLNGPRYETPREIVTFKGLGADLVGMTASSEALLMAEAGVPYGLLAIVTNLAAGMQEGPLDHSEVVDVMKETGPRVVDLLLAAAVAVGRS